MEPALSIDEKKTLEKNRTNDLNFSREAIFVAVCVLCAFLIRFFLIPPNGVIGSDGVYYARLGEKLMSGDIYGGISAYWSPLYSFLVGIASLFFEDLEFSGRFVSVIAGALLVVPAYLLVRDFYGRAAAFLSTILLVIHPSLIQSSGWVMTETLYALIFTSVVLIGSYALRRGNGRYFFIVGLLLGAAYLTKPEAIGFVGLFFVLTVGAKFFRRNLPARRLAAGYLLLVCGFAIFFVPYFLFLHEKTGNWTISQKLLSNSVIDFEKGLLNLTDDQETTMRDRLFGDVYAREVKPDENVSPSVSSSESGRKRFNFEQFASKTRHHLRKQIREHLPTILPYTFMLVALVGLFFRRRTRGQFAREIYLFSFVACTFIGYAFTVIELRYSFTVIPILLGWVCFGIVSLSHFAAQTGKRFLKGNFKLNPILVQAIILILLSLSLKPLFSSQFKHGRMQNVPFEEKQAGFWLLHNADKPSLVMSSSPIPAFYADSNHLYVPDEELPVVLDYARRKKVNYLIISERRLKNTPKTFPPDMKTLPKELKLVYKDEQNQGFRVFIFQLTN